MLDLLLPFPPPPPLASNVTHQAHEQFTAPGSLTYATRGKKVAKSNYFPLVFFMVVSGLSLSNKEGGWMEWHRDATIAKFIQGLYIL